MAKPDPDRIKKWGELGGIGPLLVASVLVGAFLGSWLDGKLGTTPWLLVAGTLLGTAAGFVQLVKLLQRIGELGKKKRKRFGSESKPESDAGSGPEGNREREGG